MSSPEPVISYPPELPVSALPRMTCESIERSVMRLSSFSIVCVRGCVIRLRSADWHAAEP